jgi:hypothetical protein
MKTEEPELRTAVNHEQNKGDKMNQTKADNTSADRCGSYDPDDIAYEDVVEFSPSDFLEAKVLEEITDFLKSLFPDNFTGFIQTKVFAHNGRKGPEDRYHTSIKEAAYYIMRNRQNDVFVGVALRKNQNGRKENVSSTWALWVDIDPGLEGHKKRGPWNTKDEFLEMLVTFEPKPDMMIDSGGGFHLYWLFDLPFYFPEDIEFVESQNQKLASLLGGDNVYDITRVMRVPGTRNSKYPGNVFAKTIKNKEI